MTKPAWQCESCDEMQTTQGMIDGHHFELTVDGPEALMTEIKEVLAELKCEVENE